MWPRRTLAVVGPDHAGDTIIALPALGALIENAEFTQVALVVNDRVAPLVSAVFPAVRCLPCPPSYHSQALTAYQAVSLAARIALLRCTDVVDLRGDRIGAAITCTVQALAPAHGARSGVDITVADAAPHHSGIQYAHEHYEGLVARALNRRPRSLTTILHEVRRLTSRAIEEPHGGRDHGICLCPGASTKSKSWPQSRWLALAQRLQREGFVVSMVARPEERFLEAGDVDGSAAIRPLPDSSLLEAAQNLALADLAVTCDSALAHLAFAVGTPVVTLFGPTEPGKWFPYQAVDGGVPIFFGDMPSCHPCQRMSCPSMTPCIERLGVNDVAQEVLGYVRQREERSHA